MGILASVIRRDAAEQEPIAGEDLLRGAVEAANREIRRHRQGDLSLMGSTIAAVLVRDRRVIIANVGDSRIYRLRGGRLEQLSRDHSLDVEFEASGAKLPAHVKSYLRHVVTRALGMDPEVEVELAVEEARAGDVFLICSDGLFEPLEPEWRSGTRWPRLPRSPATTWSRKRFRPW